MPIVFVVLCALLESFQLLAANQAIKKIDLEQYIVMQQSKSNLGGARFISPLKRQGFSAPALIRPKYQLRTNLVHCNTNHDKIFVG